MQLEPGDIYEKLEFDKVITLLERACYGEQGRQHIKAIQPLDDLANIDRLLAETDQYRNSLERRDSLALGPYEEVAQELRMLEIEGFVLPEEGLQKLNVLLLYVRDIFKFFTLGRQENYAALYAIVRPIHFNEDLLKAI